MHVETWSLLWGPDNNGNNIWWKWLQSNVIINYMLQWNLSTETQSLGQTYHCHCRQVVVMDRYIINIVVVKRWSLLIDVFPRQVIFKSTRVIGWHIRKTLENYLKVSLCLHCHASLRSLGSTILFCLFWMYSGRGPFTYMYCVVYYRVIAAQCVKSDGSVIVGLYTFVHDSEC